VNAKHENKSNKCLRWGPRGQTNEGEGKYSPTHKKYAYILHIAQYAIYIAYCTICNIYCTMHSMQYILHIAQYAIYIAYCTICMLAYLIIAPLYVFGICTVRFCMKIFCSQIFDSYWIIDNMICFIFCRADSMC